MHTCEDVMWMQMQWQNQVIKPQGERCREHWTSVTFLGAQLQFTCMISRGQQFSIYASCCASHAFSVQALCNHLEDDVMSGFSDTLLRLCAVFAGQWDGRLVQAPVLLTLQLQNKHLYWGKESTQNTQPCVYTLTTNLITPP